MAVVGIVPEIFQPDLKNGRIERNQHCDDRTREHADTEPTMRAFAELVASVGRKTDRIFRHLSSARAFFASSFPAKLAVHGCGQAQQSMA